MMHLGEVDWLGVIVDFNIVEHNGEWWQLLVCHPIATPSSWDQREDRRTAYC